MQSKFFSINVNVLEINLFNAITSRLYRSAMMFYRNNVTITIASTSTKLSVMMFYGNNAAMTSSFMMTSSTSENSRK